MELHDTRSITMVALLSTLPQRLIRSSPFSDILYGFYGLHTGIIIATL